jgi:hypothetical protein
VLKTGTVRPQTGVAVSLKRPGIIGNEQNSKSTGSDGLVRFDLRSCIAIVSINEIAQPQRTLTTDKENIFYIP